MIKARHKNKTDEKGNPIVETFTDMAWEMMPRDNKNGTVRMGYKPIGETPESVRKLKVERDAEKKGINADNEVNDESENAAKGDKVDAKDSKKDHGSETSESNLKEINGLGPSSEQRLNDAGIETLNDLVEVDQGELDEIMKGSNVDTSAWKIQAKKLS